MPPLALLFALPLALAAAPAGDAHLGERIAVKGGGDAVTACATCHGERGQGMPAHGFPPLAGRAAAWHRARLEAYARGRPEHPLMSSIARAMSRAQRDATAAYYATLPATDAKR